MNISKDTLRKEYEYNSQSSNIDLTIALILGLLFSINIFTDSVTLKILRIIVGSLFLLLTFFVLKDNYLGTLYESRLVDQNTRNPRERALLAIKALDVGNAKGEKKWWASFTTLGFWETLFNFLKLMLLGGLGIFLIIYSICLP